MWDIECLRDVVFFLIIFIILQKLSKCQKFYMPYRCLSRFFFTDVILFFFKVSVACLLVFCAIYFDELEADLEAICVYQDMQ